MASKRRKCVQCSAPHATHSGLCGKCYVGNRQRVIPASMRAASIERPIPAINPEMAKADNLATNHSMPGVMAGVSKVSELDVGRAPVVRDYIGRKHGSGRERKIVRLVSIRENGTMVRRGEASRVNGLDDKPEQIPNYVEGVSSSRKEYTLEATAQTVIAVRPNGRKTRVAGHKETSKWFSAPIHDIYIVQDIRKWCKDNGIELKERDNGTYKTLSCKDKSVFTRKGIMPK